MLIVIERGNTSSAISIDFSLSAMFLIVGMMNPIMKSGDRISRDIIDEIVFKIFIFINKTLICVDKVRRSGRISVMNLLSPNQI